MIKANSNNNLIRLILFIGLILSVFLILFNTNKIIEYTKNEERKKIELWAMAQKNFIESKNLDEDLGELTFLVLTKSFENPIIQVDANGKILSHKNIFDKESLVIDSIKLKSVLKKISQENPPIEIKFNNSINQKLYFGNSSTFNKIKYYPFALLIVAIFFSLIVFNYYKSFISSNKNKIWALFAKETAHQIGTPLSSLMGWSSILKEQKVDSNIIIEIEKDIERLNKITKRFSEIGSIPKLKKEDINDVLNSTINYLIKRNSSLIKFEFKPSKETILSSINRTLFEWVIENIVKNAIDSMKGKGNIIISLYKVNDEIQILIKDDGLGIEPKFHNKIFSSGFSLKKKGWGLGLSLSKRIITEYHNGKIFINKSEINKGTTIELNLPAFKENS
ncbi:MAG: HAMP domain-containing histidine kinase [Flavobacteriaceae bacterium]|nr:HAMP domain-containing histidine kinase [Pelagibacterales bacterium]MBT6169466.1 HAMP domain-containing histidine kinase [Flavobacteriaceae bacterium]